MARPKKPKVEDEEQSMRFLDLAHQCRHALRQNRRQLPRLRPTRLVLELVEEALDAVAQGVEHRIDRALNLSIAFCRNDRIGAVEPSVFTDRVTVIASVGEKCLWARFVQVHQFVVDRRVVRLARRDDEAERETFAVGAGVNLARKTAAGAAKTLALSPPFAPAA